MCQCRCRGWKEAWGWGSSCSGRGCVCVWTPSTINIKMLIITSQLRGVCSNLKCIYPHDAVLFHTSGLKPLITVTLPSTPPLKETVCFFFLIMSLAISLTLPSLLNPKVSCAYTNSTKLHSTCISCAGIFTMRYSLALTENWVVNDNVIRLTTEWLHWQEVNALVLL